MWRQHFLGLGAYAGTTIADLSTGTRRIVEHDMPLIMGMSDRVYCLEAGRVIAEGEPDAVRADPRVIASYLGTDERAINRSDTG